MHAGVLRQHTIMHACRRTYGMSVCKLWRAGKRGQRSRHTLDAPALEHVPASQEAHVADELAPVALEYFPATQKVHVDAPARPSVVCKSKHAAQSSHRATRGAAAVQPRPPPHDPRCCCSSSFYLSLSPHSPSLSRSRSLSARAHSLAGNTQYLSDCALFLSLARPRSFARARTHSLFFSLSLSLHTRVCVHTRPYPARARGDPCCSRCIMHARMRTAGSHWLPRHMHTHAYACTSNTC